MTSYIKLDGTKVVFTHMKPELLSDEEKSGMIKVEGSIPSPLITEEKTQILHYDKNEKAFFFEDVFVEPTVSEPKLSEIDELKLAMIALDIEKQLEIDALKMALIEQDILINQLVGGEKIG